MVDFEKIKSAYQKEIELPGWDDEPFVATLRRPSLMALVSTGKIPNELRSAVDELFSTGGFKKADYGEQYDVLRAVAGACLVSPTLDELDENGIELTDNQLVAIYSYSQGGTRALARFRNFSNMLERSNDGAEISEPTE